MDDDGWIILDDRDPGINYSGPQGGVLWYGGVSEEYCTTTTGLDTGDTLTYSFSGSGIAVYGTYGPTGEAGPPVAIYRVDNTSTTVTAPTTQVTLYRQNFFVLGTQQLPSLALPGAVHTLLVTLSSQNNTLWVDYLAYLLNNSTTTALPPAPTCTASAATSYSIATSTSLTTSLTPTVATTASSSQDVASNTHTNTGIFVAGIIIGTLGFILATTALAVYTLRRFRSRTPTTGHLVQSEIDGPTNVSNNDTCPVFPSDTPHAIISQFESFQSRRPLPPTPTRALDGGVRVMGESLALPPAYQERY